MVIKRKYTESQLKAVSSDIASSIVIHSYDLDVSDDHLRFTTTPEREIVQKIAYGALLTYNAYGGDIDTVALTAEGILKLFIPECNGYDTLYTPLSEVMETIEI